MALIRQCHLPGMALRSLGRTSFNIPFSSADNSSGAHHFTYSHTLDGLRSWLDTAWKHNDARHERIALGHVKQGMAVTTREMMEMQVQHAPNLRGMMDCLPIKQPLQEMGWRPKLGTWPLSKHEALVAKQWSA